MASLSLSPSSPSLARFTRVSVSVLKWIISSLHIAHYLRYKWNRTSGRFTIKVLSPIQAYREQLNRMQLNVPSCNKTNSFIYFLHSRTLLSCTSAICDFTNRTRLLCCSLSLFLPPLLLLFHWLTRCPCISITGPLVPFSTLHTPCVCWILFVNTWWHGSTQLQLTNFARISLVFHSCFTACRSALFRLLYIVLFLFSLHTCAESLKKCQHSYTIIYIILFSSLVSLYFASSCLPSIHIVFALSSLPILRPHICFIRWKSTSSVSSLAL